MILHKTSLKRAVFLDRDGTLNHDPGYVHKVEDLELLEHVPEGLVRIAALGYELVITTNQSGIARGYYTEAEMHAFNRALCARLADHGVQIAGVYYCPFHPSEGIGPYRRESSFRKPQSGMLLMASAERGIDLRASVAIGDKPSDVAAGRGAQCRTVLLARGLSRQEIASAAADHVAENLLEAADYLERTQARPIARYGRAG